MIATTPLQRMAPTRAFSALPHRYCPSPKSNILFVNQNKGELDTLTRVLNDTYDIFSACNERCLMIMMEKHPIHMIIISLELNSSGRSNLCLQLKSSVKYAHIPIILLIDSNNLHSKLKSLESGADAYIERPLSPEYINVQIKSLMANRARIKDYFAHSLFAHMTTMTRSKANETFLNRLNDFISNNLQNPDLDIDLLARLMNISRPTLYRKVKSISELTPNELITIARLNKAATLISTGEYMILDVAKMVGFNSRSNFGKAFFKHFSLTPTAYQKLKKDIAA